MTIHYTQDQVPPAALHLTAQKNDDGHLSEKVSLLALVAPYTVPYSDGTPSDLLPVNVPAVVYGGSLTTFDVTLYVWLVVTVVGSNILSVIHEADITTLTGDYAVLARIERGAITCYQQS